MAAARMGVQADGRMSHLRRLWDRMNEPPKPVGREQDVIRALTAGPINAAALRGRFGTEPVGGCYSKGLIEYEAAKPYCTRFQLSRVGRDSA